MTDHTNCRCTIIPPYEAAGAGGHNEKMSNGTDPIIDRIVQNARCHQMSLPRQDAEELGALIGGILKPETIASWSDDPWEGVRILSEVVRYAYTIGYRRGKAAGMVLVVAEEKP